MRTFSKTAGWVLSLVFLSPLVRPVSAQCVECTRDKAVLPGHGPASQITEVSGDNRRVIRVVVNNLGIPNDSSSWYEPSAGGANPAIVGVLQTAAQRNEIMPINRKYPIADLLGACRAYPLRPWEHITFEYVLLGGFNDAPDDARRLAKLINGIRCKVNLIPWNPGELPYHPPDPQRTEAMRRILTEKDIPAFVRYARGADIMAACGQLALLEISLGTP